MFRSIICSLILGLLFAGRLFGAEKRDVTQFVDPFIGTDGHGHTFPGATVPFGMVQLSPDNGKTGWDWCSGYHYSCDTIVGFSHTHLSGTGCADLGDILFTPFSYGQNPAQPIVATFKHENERAVPGYYSVRLDNEIFVELTATERCGVHRYTFNRGQTALLAIDLGYGQEDSPVETSLTIEDSHTVSGYRYSAGWSPEQRIYFVAEFSGSIMNSVFSANDTIRPNVSSLTAKRTNAVFTLDTAVNPSEIRVGISAVSIAGARNNLETEVGVHSFDEIRAQASAAWNRNLSRIKVEMPTDADQKTFYTALYHALLAPTLFCDVDSSYRGGDKQNHRGGFQCYSTFSLWDTYRAAHPLYTIIQPGRVNDFVNSMIAFCKQYGLLPIWPLAGDETWCMIGYHAVPVIADAYLKGFSGFDANDALEAMTASAAEQERGLEYYNRARVTPLREKLAELNVNRYVVPDEWQRDATSGTIVRGYMKSISGETIHYHSSYPYVEDALLVRPTDGKMQIEWQTEPVPASLESDTVTFIWVAGNCTHRGGHRFDLYANDKFWLSFNVSQDTSRKFWSATGDNGTVFTFLTGYRDRFNDLFGEAFLKVPKKLLKPGEPLTLKIIGENAGSRDWFMTFEHIPHDTLSVVEEYAAADDNGMSKQIVSVFIESVSPPSSQSIPATIRLTYDASHIEKQSPIRPGLTVVNLPLNELKGPKKAEVSVSGSIALPPQEMTLHPVAPVRYIPADKERESASKTLEYAYDDWCIAQVASQLGSTSDAAYFADRATYWKNLFDPATGFMRGKNFDGSWVSPFDPRFSTEKQPEYTEGNAWQYTWYVPHDVPGLIETMGGNAKFSLKLDSLFNQSSDLEGTGATADVSGLIGLYAHGNEPSHHIAYLYDFCGQPWKTQKLIHQIMRDLYADKVDGLCGNEDCGQMSAWYIFSALGFYPVNPADGKYMIGSPLVKRATIDVGAGKSFTVIAENQSDSSPYIQSATLNGSALGRLYITHAEIVKGGELKFIMGDTPNRKWGRLGE